MIRGGTPLALLVAPFALIVATMTAPPSAAQQLPDPDARIQSLQAWDQAIDGLHQATQTILVSRAYFGTDIRGLTIVEDWNAQILPPQARTALEGLRATADAQAAAGDQRGLQATVATAAPLIRTEARKALLLSAYWRDSTAVRLHRDLLLPWLERVSDYDRKVTLDHVTATEQRLLEQLQKALSTTRDDVTRTVDQMRRLRRTAAIYYNDKRMLFAHQQTDAALAAQLPSRTRSSPCPPPVAAKAGSMRKYAAGVTTPMGKYYPPAARINDVMGDVVLEMEVSAVGCMEHAKVIRTSGTSLLDEAALVWTESALFRPPMKGREFVPGKVEFTVVFWKAD
ncbi:MAG: TonB family protein [Steroidobacteraceae bacterium]|nr:TonB family protein [Steroidobacteraceae bacterium]